MVTFDKIKIVAPLGVVRIIERDKFEIIQGGGRLKSIKKTLTTPFSLSMELNYQSGEFIMEFTGKVLGERYPELISKETILECFDKINELGYCIVDKEKIMHATVVKCDVTKDIPVEDFSGLTNWLRGNVVSYQKYNCRQLRNGNLIVEKNVSSHKRKKRITIYNKEQEMGTRKEREYVSTNGLEDKFSGLCRFELNLTSQAQIRDALGITGNTLAEVLNADKNPIADFVEDIICDGHDNAYLKDHSWKTYQKVAILKDCNYDIEQVEARLREYYDPSRTSIVTKLRPYRELLEGKGCNDHSWTKQKLLAALD